MWRLTKSDVCPKDHKRFEEYAKHSETKHAIAAELKPTSILEVGVRAGYSALSFLKACPSARYLGIDAESGEHGGQGGPWMWWAKKILEPYDATLIHANSQLMEEPPGPRLFDMIHVDGDHSRIGALHDMEMLWPALAIGGTMIVDDLDYIRSVLEAVQEFMSNHTDAVFEKRRSIRGEGLIRKMES